MFVICSIKLVGVCLSRADFPNSRGHRITVLHVILDIDIRLIAASLVNNYLRELLFYRITRF